MMNNAAAAAAVTVAVTATAATALEHNPSAVAPSNSLAARGPPNPRKKRTKLSRIEKPLGAVATAVVKRKPDPSAPKITRPCTECGKKFWSWKALFGHMRCHPERQWRGINPPPNLRNRLPEVEEEGIRCLSGDAAAGGAGGRVTMITTEDDYEVAACLLMLANSTIPIPSPSPSPVAAYFCYASAPIPTVSIVEDDSGEGRTVGGNIDGDHNCRFECSCCRKVFTSHQALGGHRASHRNVKGCFAITTTTTSKNDGDPDGDFNDADAVLMELTRSNVGGGENRNSLIGEYSHSQYHHHHHHHKCGICSRVFSSGQALGGHKRCHWEKSMINNDSLTPSSSAAAPAPPLLTPAPSSYHQHPDLNSPAAAAATLESSSTSVCQDCHNNGFLSGRPNSYYSLSSSIPGLDLKLGL